jgi:hypothetical protein
MPLVEIPHFTEPLVDPNTGMMNDRWFRFFSDLAEDPLRISRDSLTLSNGANADVKLPRAQFLTITGPSASFSISGFQGGYESRPLILYNPTAQAMTLTNDATSTAANRILTLTGADRTTTGTGIAMLRYSAVSSRWLVESFEA